MVGILTDRAPQNLDGRPSLVALRLAGDDLNRPLFCGQFIVQSGVKGRQLYGAVVAVEALAPGRDDLEAVPKAEATVHRGGSIERHRWAPGKRSGRRPARRRRPALGVGPLGSGTRLMQGQRLCDLAGSRPS